MQIWGFFAITSLFWVPVVFLAAVITSLFWVPVVFLAAVFRCVKHVARP